MRPRTVDKIAKAVEERPEQLARARERGAKVVGYFCSYMPEEIIHALGLIAVRLGRGGNDDLVELGGQYISTDNCVFLRQSVGLFADGKDSFASQCDHVAVAASCIQMYRLAEVIKYYFKVPTLVLGVPRNFYLDEGKAFFRKEVENFSLQLETFAGRKLDGTALKESVQLYHNIRQMLLKIYEYQALDPAPISWNSVFDVIHAGFYLDPVHYLSLLQELVAELISLREGLKSTGTAPDKRPRILLSGTVIPPGDHKLTDIIEESGGRVVADDFCTGRRFFSDLEVKDFSLTGVADAYLNKVPCATLPYLASLETDRRLAFLTRLIDEYRVEGMLYHTLRFCDAFSIKGEETKSFFKDKIAFLEIHTEYADSDYESIRTRVDAFMELLDSRRSTGKPDV